MGSVGAEVAGDERSVDHGRPGLLAGGQAGRFPSSQQPHADCPEIPAAGILDQCRPELVAGNARYRDFARIPSPERRDARRRRGGLHTGDRRYALKCLLVEPVPVGGSVVVAGRKRDGRNQDVARVEPEIDPDQRDEAAHEQPGPQQQDQRDRDLGGDQRVSQRPPPTGDAFAVALEALHQIPACAVERGRNPEQQRRQDGDSETEGERLAIQSELDFSRQRTLRKEPDERLDASIREEAARGGSKQSEEQALDQQLPDDAPPAGAERRSDRHFALAGRGSRQEHVGDVAAGNQHEAAPRPPGPCRARRGSHRRPRR